MAYDELADELHKEIRYAACLISAALIASMNPHVSTELVLDEAATLYLGTPDSLEPPDVRDVQAMYRAEKAV